jgi:thiazole tautomerase (transcriptional regulator TenI)
MDESTPRLCVIGARAAFDRDPAWLQALARVGRGIRALGLELPLVLQVRIEEEREDAEELAQHALDAVRSFAPRSLRVVLNAAGVQASTRGYDGVHWPERRIADTRPAAQGTVSASVHSLEALQRAERAGVDYVQFGPIWEPTWKVATPRGLGALKEAAHAAKVPVVAVGGVRPERVAACLESGAAGVAVVSGVFGAADVESALRRYMDALAASAPGPIGDSTR